MEKILDGKKVAVLIDHGFEQVEFTEPVKAIKEAGADVFVISKEKIVKGWNKRQWGNEFQADILLDKANAEEFDALVLPGGVMSPDKLRMNETAVAFVKHFMKEAKPVAAICHGPWTLIETGMLNGRKMTSYPSLKTDLLNAGVNWVDQEVVVDRGLVTSRKPDDIPAFIKKAIEEISEGPHKKKEKSTSESKSNLREAVRNRLNENLDDRNWEEVDNRRDPHDDL